MASLPITAISTPAEGSAGYTGSWRTERPVLDRAKCIRCLLCWLYCPEGAVVRGEDDSIDIDYSYCKGCMICARECPVRAIAAAEEG